MSPLNHYSRIVSRLQKLRGRLLAVNLGTGMLAGLAFVGAAFLVATALSLAGVAPVGIRVGWWLVFVVGLLGILGPVIWRYFIAPPTPEKVALIVEARYPQLKNRLIASLQLRNVLTENREGYSTDLVGRTVEQADNLTSDKELSDCVDRNPLRQWLLRTGVLAIMVTVTALLFPGAVNRAVSSFSRPLTPILEPLKYSMQVYPGDAQVIKFDTLAVRAVLTGSDMPATLQLMHRAEGGQWRTEELRGTRYSSGSLNGAVDSIVYSERIGPLIRDVEYIMSTERMTSPTYTLTAQERPRVTGIRLSYFYPEYTGLEPQVYDENDGTLMALNGTDVELSIRSNRALQAAELVFNDGARLPLTVRDRVATGQITVERDAIYHIRLLDQPGYENPHPIDYPISVLADAHPRVEILLPGHDANLDEEMSVNLKVAAVDDFGFSDLKLVYRWISGGQVRAEKELALPLPQDRTNTVESDFWWDLEPLGMMPSDVVSYHVEVTDNDQVTGPKSTVSKTYTLRFPSLDELMAEVDRQQYENILDLEEILRGERELMEEVKQFHREMLRTDEPDWQMQQQMESLSEKRNDLTQKFADAAQEFSEGLEQLQEKRLASAEMIAKLAEAQQLFQEVATEEMKEQARQLAEMMKEMDANEMSELLENMEISTEEMIERLERTIEYLKRLQAEQKIDQLVKRAEELLQRQEQLNEDVSKADADQLSSEAERQDKLREDFDQLAEDMAESKEMLTDANLANPQLIEQFSQLARQSPAPQQMADASQAMQQEQQQQAQQSGKQASESLSQMIDSMKKMQEAMTNQMREEIAAMLRDALEQAMYLSEHQEALRQSTNEATMNSPSMSELAELQSDLLAGTQRLEAAMQEIGKKSMCLGGRNQGLQGVAENMNNAIDQLTRNNGHGASTPQRNAMAGLNQTAQQLMQGMQQNSGQCNNPGGGQCSKPGGGMMPQMSGLANRQGRINMKMDQLMQEMGNSMSAEQRLALSRLKGEQQAIKRGIDELAPQTENRRNLLGRLDHLGKEMKKVIENLERYEVSPETRTRMQRIFSRMLDFQHSLHRQDYKEERQARFGEDILRNSPAELDFNGIYSDQQLHRLLKGYLDEGYPRAYEALIKSYYRELLESKQNTGQQIQ